MPNSERQNLGPARARLSSQAKLTRPATLRRGRWSAINQQARPQGARTTEQNSQEPGTACGENGNITRKVDSCYSYQWREQQEDICKHAVQTQRTSNNIDLRLLEEAQAPGRNNIIDPWLLKGSQAPTESTTIDSRLLEGVQINEKKRKHRPAAVGRSTSIGLRRHRPAVVWTHAVRGTGSRWTERR